MTTTERGIERRVIDGPLEVRENDDGTSMLVGMAPPWGKWSKRLGDFVERFDKDAFTNLSKRDTIIQCTVGHRDEDLLGTTPKTLRLNSTPEGLAYEVDVPDTEVGRSAVVHTQRGDFRGSSFEFRTVSDTWDTSKTPAERTVHKALLFAVNPCVNPAYADTSVATRELRELRGETVEPPAEEDGEQAERAEGAEGAETRAGVSPSDVSASVAPDDTQWSRPTLSDFTDKQFSDMSPAARRKIAGYFALADRMPPQTYGELHFPHHDPGNGHVVPRGVYAAAGRLPSSGFSAEDKSTVQTHLGRHYHAMDMKAPWDRSADDWAAYEARECQTDGAMIAALADLGFRDEAHAIAEELVLAELMQAVPDLAERMIDRLTEEPPEEQERSDETPEESEEREAQADSEAAEGEVEEKRDGEEEAPTEESVPLGAPIREAQLRMRERLASYDNRTEN